MLGIDKALATKQLKIFQPDILDWSSQIACCQIGMFVWKPLVDGFLEMQSWPV
jgi:hypothetical protein